MFIGIFQPDQLPLDETYIVSKYVAKPLLVDGKFSWQNNFQYLKKIEYPIPIKTRWNGFSLYADKTQKYSDRFDLQTIIM